MTDDIRGPPGPSVRRQRSDENDDEVDSLGDSVDAEYVDEQFAEVKQRLRELESEISEKADEDHSARERASIRRRVHEVESRLDNLEGQVHYGKEKRKQLLIDILIDTADSDGRSMISADDITDEFDVSPRTARNYMGELGEEYEGVKYRRVDKLDASTPKRLYLSLENFIEGNDEYEFR